MTTNFDQAMAGDARLLARFDAVAEKLIADAAAEGLTLDRESLKGCPGVKLAVFTDMALPADVMDEVKRLPELAPQLRKREIDRQLAQGDSDLHAGLARMNHYQRLAFGRDLEAARAAEQATAAQKPATMDAESEAKFLIMLRRLPPAARITAARAAGMI